MGGDVRRDVGLGEHCVHRGQPARGVAGVAGVGGVGHGFLALVVSRAAGFGTGISTTPRPSVATPLKLIAPRTRTRRSEEHTSELQSQSNLVCRLLLEKKKKSRRLAVTDVS